MAMAVSTLLVPSIGNATIVESDVVAWWSMDETSGVRYDSSANGNDLTDNNTVGYTTGVVSNSADTAAASSEYLSSASTDFDFGDTGYSLCGWFNLDSVAGWNWLFSKLGSGDYAYRLDAYTTALTWRVYNGVTTGIAEVGTGAGVINAGTWFFVCVYHDASANTIGISVNNATFTTQATTGGAGDSATTFKIAYDIIGASYSSLNVDEVVILNRVITQGEVSDLYNSGNGISYTDFFTTSTTSTSTATTTSTTTTDVSELIWVMELYLSMMLFLIFTYIGYRFTKLFI